MFQVREQHHHTTEVLTLTGPFDRRSTAGIQILILAAQNTGCHHIVLDFSRVTEIDSTSLSKLFLWCHNMKPHQGEVCVVKPPPYIRYHEDWAHLSEIVPIYGSLDEAMDQEDPY